MKIEDYPISEQIKKNANLLGYKRPTDIQFKSIPSILKGEDVLAIAQTGTGKTAAFVIPILSKLEYFAKSHNRAVRCLVMVPTRELALQITKVFHQLGKSTGVNTTCLFGGVDQDRQITKLEEGTDVVVATPGRMFDFISQGYLKLGKIDILVLDEADHMLDLGFIKDIEDIKRKLVHRHQTLFFSATINKKIKQTAYSLVRSEAIRIQISPKNPVSKNVDHSVLFVEMDDKRFFLERLINEHPDKKILVFVRTKVRAERVMKAMERVEIETATIHGDKDQNDRIQVLELFSKSRIKILIATDVSARGIDIPSVDFVVNYDMPDEPSNYVHRVGRTGRGRLHGKAYSFCSTEEKTLLAEIEQFTGNEIEINELTKADYEETKLFTEDHDSNWKKLLKQDEWESKKKKKR